MLAYDFLDVTLFFSHFLDPIRSNRCTFDWALGSSLSKTKKFHPDIFPIYSFTKFIYLLQGGSMNKFLHQRLSVAVLDIKGNYHLEREFSWGEVKSRPEISEKM